MDSLYYEVKIDSRGRTTIPADILQHLGIPEGGTIVYLIKEDGLVWLSAKKLSD